MATQDTGANLDARLDVYTSAGALVASSNEPVPVPSTSRLFTTGLSASLVFSALPVGAYFARVTSTGQGDPRVDGYTNYGSLDQYTVSAHPARSITTGSLVTATLGGPYSQPLTSAGGSPPGMSLSSAGVIAGTSTTGGFTSTVTVRVRDKAGSTTTKRLSPQVR